MNGNSLTTVKAGITAFLATLTAFWGWFGWLTLAWILLMLADWLIGSATAAKQGKWESCKMREGAWHKGGEIVIVIVALVFDWLISFLIAQVPAVKLPFTYSVLLGPLVMVWYIIGELGSLAEHAVNMGANVPPWLVNMLAAGKKAVDTAGNKISDSAGTSSEAKDEAN